MDVLLVATFEDFDETLDKRLRGVGSGRKQANQALVHYLCASKDIRQLDLLILDWKNPPKAAKEVKLSLHRTASQKVGTWGSREQLLAKFPAHRWDIAICTQARRFVLDFTAHFKTKKHLVMLHDYNIPVGPWGQEQTPQQLSEHVAMSEKFEFLCASRHLAEYVEKWSDGRFTSHCTYAADYNYFDPVPEPTELGESQKFVTFVGPCPEKGLSIFLRLAELMSEVPFLAVKTTWTKAWHEPLLKKVANVKVQSGSENLDDFLKHTRVLIVPSVWQEAYGLIVTEAQLRGIPVVSTDVCGLVEANRVPDTLVRDIPMVYDQRTHELVVGMTMDVAEGSLSVNRPGALTMEQWRQSAVTQESCQKVARDEDVAKFVEILQKLLAGEERARQVARLAASSFVDGRRERFVGVLKGLLEKHEAAGDAPAASAIVPTVMKPATKTKAQADADGEDYSFDVNQDFTQSASFDGAELAAKCLVRLCEQGNLTVSAELILAKADVNRAEPDVGITPLIGAANGGHLDVCKYLLRKEADVNTEVDDGTSRTALHAASNMGFASVVQLLLEKRADPRVEDLTKTTPLHLAVRHGHAGASEILMKHKANPNQADDQGQIPINDAVAKDRFDIVSKLLEFGSLVNVRNMAGLEAISFSRTPAMQALVMKHDVNF